MLRTKFPMRAVFQWKFLHEAKDTQEHVANIKCTQSMEQENKNKYM